MLRVRLLRFRIAGPILASLAAGLSSLCLSLPFQSSPARPDAASPHHFIATFFPSSSNTAKAAIVQARLDRKSTRLNSSHGYISYAVFCLKTQNKVGAVCLRPRVPVRRGERSWAVAQGIVSGLDVSDPHALPGAGARSHRLGAPPRPLPLR